MHAGAVAGSDQKFLELTAVTRNGLCAQKVFTPSEMNYLFGQNEHLMLYVSGLACVLCVTVDCNLHQAPHRRLLCLCNA